MPENADTRIGHRKRLREKYLLAGPDAFLDYEILELLLSYAMARRDVKPMAKQLMEKYNKILMPIILILLGIYVLIKSGVIL